MAALAAGAGAASSAARSQRFALALLALLALCMLAGCGGSESKAAAPLATAGKTIVRIDNHLGWPYQIEGLWVRVDGRPVSSLSGELPATTWLEPLPLSPGWHMMVVRVVMGYASDMVGGRCTVQLRKLQVFAVAAEPVTVVADLHLRGVTHGFSDRPDVTVRIRGARAISLDLLRELRQAEKKCGEDMGADTLLCRAEQRTARASSHRDDFGHQCFAPKLAAMRKLADVRGRWLERLKEDPQAEAPAGNPAAMVLLAERRIETVWRELEECAPYATMPLGDLTRSVEGAGCDSRAPAALPADR